jgi:hypothetical protein
MPVKVKRFRSSVVEGASFVWELFQPVATLTGAELLNAKFRTMSFLNRALRVTILLSIAFAFEPSPIVAIELSVPALSEGKISFSFESSSNQLFTVQAAVSPDQDWTDLLFRRGDGAPILFSTNIIGDRQFFRVRSSPFTNLDLQPNAPTLIEGAISLLDAEHGVAYLQQLTLGLSGVPPYSLTVTGTPPDGVIVDIRSNQTASASIQISSSGTSLTSGQRREFSVEVVDAANTTLTRQFNLRVVAPAPRVDLDPLQLKAGETVNFNLIASGGEGSLVWNAVNALPDGVDLSGDGHLSGIPSADAAERDETGEYITTIEVSDSFTDRVTGEPAPRKATATTDITVRLSYNLNILAGRPNGPSFSQICVFCHGPGFHPNYTSAPAIIDVRGGAGGACDNSRVYISPGDPSKSLIYLKLSEAPPCGDRMPAGGPYFSDQQLNRLARWIRELKPGETD